MTDARKERDRLVLVLREKGTPLPPADIERVANEVAGYVPPAPPPRPLPRCPRCGCAAVRNRPDTLQLEFACGARVGHMELLSRDEQATDQPHDDRDA